MLIVKAFGKINLTLRVLGVREDGYHALRTVFQSIALHDTLTFQPTSGAFRIACDDPACPTDRSNLVWRAAESVWKAAGRRGQPRDVSVGIAKRMPLQSGLGGGSSDAAAAIRGLAALWRVRLSREWQQAMAAGLGADVPFFLEGGTSLGVDRGDVLFPLAEPPAVWVTLAVPNFGVSTKEAYEWFDRDRSPEGLRHSGSRLGHIRSRSGAGLQPCEAWGLPPGEFANDLQRPVSNHHPEIGRLVASLRRQGAMHAAMSGSGSAVFGLFEARGRAEAAARALAGPRCRTIVTRTLNRVRFQRLSRPG